MVLGALIIGPRWNTHTNVCSLGPIPMGETREATFEIENVSEPNYSWQVVAYAQSLKQETISAVSAQQGGPQWLPLKVRA